MSRIFIENPCNGRAWKDMKKYFSPENVKQFISYVGVGGVAALVEWGVFSLLEYGMDMPYLLATVLAFFVSTTVNWILGRTFTFRDSSYDSKRGREMFLVFLVSAIGLGFNLCLMYMLVDVLGLRTNLLKTLAKVLATGIVFIWNFLSRKLWIYRKTG